MSWMQRRTSRCFFLVAFLACAQALAQDRVEIAEGAGSFQYVDTGGSAARAMTVWTYRARDLRPSARVVFVMHGVNRDGKRYRDQWQKHADSEGFVVIAPELDASTFSTRAYQRGNLVDEKGAPLPPREWSFGVIERLFDVVRRTLRLTTSTYAIYGHSAGAQFVHRFVLFVPGSRCSLAVAANAGWYTMPTLEKTFPYGLGRSPATEETLKAALGKNFVILVGEDDTDASDPDLRNTDRANEQGRNRFERARTFYETAQATSTRLGVPLRWQYLVVRDAGHSNRAMSAAAARLFR